MTGEMARDGGLAVVLCGHGTRHADGAAGFRAVAGRVRERLPGLIVRSWNWPSRCCPMPWPRWWPRAFGGSW